MSRSLWRCVAAELWGTFLLVFFGCGAVHTAVLLDALTGLWQVAIVWGVAIMVSVFSIGAISGAHINPAITLAAASWGGFPWRRVGPYIAAQVGGAFLAAAVLFAFFHPWIAEREALFGVARGGPGSEVTAMCYGEYFPNPGLLPAGPYDAAAHAALNAKVSEPVAFLAEVLGTAVLAFVVAAVTDPRNHGGPGKMAPVFIGLTVAALIVVIAPLTQACFNPARDFGPRLFAFFAGWGAVALPGPRTTGFVTVYIAAPIVGGWLGMGLFHRVFRPALHDEPVTGGERP